MTRGVHKLFEKLIPFMFRPESINQWSNYFFDNFKFIIHEMFLYSIALLVKFERFDSIAALINDDYYIGETHEHLLKPVQSFDVIYQDVVSLRHRNQRLNLRRLSLRADLLKQRCQASGLSFRKLMQADFLAYFSSAVMCFNQNGAQRWWPDTLLYFESSPAPFEIFARAESRRYFDKIRPLLGIRKKEELGRMLGQFAPINSQPPAPLWIPRWEYRTFDLRIAMNFEQLATKP